MRGLGVEEVEKGWGLMRCKGLGWKRWRRVGVEEVEKGWGRMRCKGVGGGRGGGGLGTDEM